MKAAVLCPGPSLVRTWADDFEGMTVGVNRVPLAYSCDVWAAMDYPFVLRWSGSISGRPTLLTNPDSARSLKNHGWSWRGRLVTSDALHEFCPAVFGWELWTLTAAMIFAAFSGADKIACYGVDWRGSEDFDGDASAENRTDARWVREAAKFGQVVRWLNSRGVSVSRNN